MRGADARVRILRQERRGPVEALKHGRHLDLLGSGSGPTDSLSPADRGRIPG